MHNSSTCALAKCVTHTHTCARMCVNVCVCARAWMGVRKCVRAPLYVTFCLCVPKLSIPRARALAYTLHMCNLSTILNPWHNCPRMMSTPKGARFPCAQKDAGHHMHIPHTHTDTPSFFDARPIWNPSTCHTVAPPALPPAPHAHIHACAPRVGCFPLGTDAWQRTQGVCGQSPHATTG